ncbi:phosphoenolpyruvate-dependent sugar PTS family porter, EIIA 2 [Peptostreptococcaceae bacterium AS15]|nr:phosphoenolpyruvate-dependent sugar phosphotransferase system, EIIA 2 [[Eubacterium] yurii subsp. margaretiae ATCC 43715]EJP20231.1 phosphoenolpyruvate-dependent sugar PTS family porter, EIIA 2 [Peptostreptococcaceae bacterium AS15]
MLRDLVRKNHFNFVDEVYTWRESIVKACEPLVKDGTVKGDYAFEIIKNIEKYGPYMIVMPGVVMPHSQENSEFVNNTAISFMKLEKPISFDKDDKDSFVTLFFTLASCDNKEHLKNMKNLSLILSNEELMEDLHKVKDENDLLRLAEKYNL